MISLILLLTFDKMKSCHKLAHLLISRLYYLFTLHLFFLDLLSLLFLVESF